MKISNREKGLLAVFVIVAIFILMPGDSNPLESEKDTKVTHKFTMILKRYKKIHSLDKFEKEKESTMSVNVKRNIFKFGQPKIKEKNKAEIQQEREAMLKLEQEQKVLEETNKQIEQKPQPPEVNFKVEGVIRTKTGNAVVISKSPEIFVIRENKKFFNKFIFKKVNAKNIVLGFIGFDTEKIIPIEDRGL